MVGNKCDLSNKYRKVYYEQASFFAHQNRCIFMEVSARKSSGIQESFENLIKLFINNKKRPKIIEEIEDKKTTTSKKDCVIM